MDERDLHARSLRYTHSANNVAWVSSIPEIFYDVERVYLR